MDIYYDPQLQITLIKILFIIIIFAIKQYDHMSWSFFEIGMPNLLDPALWEILYMNISDMLNPDISGDSFNGGPQGPRPPSNNNVTYHDESRPRDRGEGSSSSYNNAPLDESSATANVSAHVAEGSSSSSAAANVNAHVAEGSSSAHVHIAQAPFSSAPNRSVGRELARYLEKAKRDELARRASENISSKSVNLSDINFRLKTQDPGIDLTRERMVKDLNRILLESTNYDRRGKFASTVINAKLLREVRKF